MSDFFLCFGSMSNWPTYSDLSRSNFFWQFLGGEGPPKKIWPWTVNVSRSNKPTPTFQEKSEIFFRRSVMRSSWTNIDWTKVIGWRMYILYPDVGLNMKRNLTSSAKRVWEESRVTLACLYRLSGRYENWNTWEFNRYAIPDIK